MSYLRANCDSSLTYADWQWVVTIKTAVTGILMPFAGDVTRRVGVTPVVIVGCILFTYFFFNFKITSKKLIDY
jgi:hypothetical protein